METTISINDVELYAHHGYYEEERCVGQMYRLTLQVVIGSVGYNDDIDNTINYEELYSIIVDEMSTPRLLLETVVESIIRRIRSSYATVTSGSLILYKPQPQMGGKIGSTSVQMTW